MKKPTDVERLLQRIGLTDMRYHEFAPDPDPVRARENWSLVDASVAPGWEEGTPAHVPLARPAPPVRRFGAFYDRVAELRDRKISPAGANLSPSGISTGASSEATAEEKQAGQPLHNVFTRIRGEPPGSREAPSEPEAATPLSQVFKRLS